MSRRKGPPWTANQSATAWSASLHFDRLKKAPLGVVSSVCQVMPLLDLPVLARNTSWNLLVLQLCYHLYIKQGLGSSPPMFCSHVKMLLRVVKSVMKCEVHSWHPPLDWWPWGSPPLCWSWMPKMRPPLRSVARFLGVPDMPIKVMAFKSRHDVQHARFSWCRGLLHQTALLQHVETVCVAWNGRQPGNIAARAPWWVVPSKVQTSSCHMVSEWGSTLPVSPNDLHGMTMYDQ